MDNWNEMEILESGYTLEILLVIIHIFMLIITKTK